MKRIITAAVSAAFVALAGCSTVDQNLTARKNLEKCRFDFSGLEFERLHFGANGPESADFTVLVTVTNPNSSDVVLDHVDADLYLEQKKVGTIQHKNFLRIAAKSSSSEKVAVTVPFSDAWLLAGSRPEFLTVDAIVRVNILLGNFTLVTPMEITVKKIVPVPWDKIDKDLDAKKNAVSGALRMLFKR